MEEYKNNVFAEQFRQGLQARKMPFDDSVDEKNTVAFKLPMKAKNINGIRVRLIVNAKGDCKLRTYLGGTVPQAKAKAMLKTLNKLNGEFRYICLHLDAELDVSAAYDFDLREDMRDLFDYMMEKVFIFAEICDRCIPDIMRTVWGQEELELDDIKVDLFGDGV